MSNRTGQELKRELREAGASRSEQTRLNRVADELRALQSVKRDPAAAAETLRAITGKRRSVRARRFGFGSFGWRPVLAAIVAVLVIGPFVIGLAGAGDPLASVRGVFGGSDQAEIAPATPAATPTADAAGMVRPVAPADERSAAIIEQAPDSEAATADGQRGSPRSGQALQPATAGGVTSERHRSHQSSGGGLGRQVRNAVNGLFGR